MKKCKFLNTSGSESFRQRCGARVFHCTVLDTGICSSYRLVQKLKPLNTALHFSFFKISKSLILQYLIVQILCLALYSKKSHGCYVNETYPFWIPLYLLSPEITDTVFLPSSHLQPLFVMPILIILLLLLLTDFLPMVIYFLSTCVCVVLCLDMFFHITLYSIKSSLPFSTPGVLLVSGSSESQVLINEKQSQDKGRYRKLGD